jgi:hypothetical protein
VEWSAQRFKTAKAVLLQAHRIRVYNDERWSASALESVWMIMNVEYFHSLDRFIPS